MKKILSLLLVGVMVFSMIPAAYATNTYENPTADTEMGTNVAATGELTTVNDDGTVSHDVSYTITVPAKLAPAGSGTVTLKGVWPSDATVKVTAEESVDMLNTISGADKKTLTVTFPGIEKAGNNNEEKTYTETVSVADIEKALFGTWEGVFHYNVDYVAGDSGDSGSTDGGSTDVTYCACDAAVDTDSNGVCDTCEKTIQADEGGEEATIITFTISTREQQAEEGMTWEEWVNSSYPSDTWNLEITNNQVICNGTPIKTVDYSAEVLPSDAIIANATYQLY